VFAIYADGSSGGRSNEPYGWGWLITDGMNILAWNSGGGPSGTNNIAELTGAIEGVRYWLQNFVLGPGVDPDTQVELVCDSEYVLGMASGKHTPVKNYDLCTELRRLCLEAKLTCRWVRGHSGEPFNHAVDILAGKGRAVYLPPPLPKNSTRRFKARQEERARRKELLASKESK